MQRLFNIKKNTENTDKIKQPQSPRNSNSIFGLTILLLILAVLLSSCKEKDLNGTPKGSERSSKEEVEKSLKYQGEMIGNSDTKAKDDLPRSFVTVVTDKMLYSQGKSIELQVKNDLTFPIWYINFTQRDLVFWRLEKFQNDKWEALDFRLPLMENGKEICRLVMYERPIGAVAAISPNSSIAYEWNQKLCRFEGANVTKQFGPEVLDRGKYRFIFRYSLKTVTTENNDAKPWKRPLDLGVTQLVYSNEFTVK